MRECEQVPWPHVLLLMKVTAEYRFKVVDALLRGCDGSWGLKLVDDRTARWRLFGKGLYIMIHSCSKRLITRVCKRQTGGCVRLQMGTQTKSGIMVMPTKYQLKKQTYRKLVNSNCVPQALSALYAVCRFGNHHLRPIKKGYCPSPRAQGKGRWSWRPHLSNAPWRRMRMLLWFGGLGSPPACACGKVQQLGGIKSLPIAASIRYPTRLVLDACHAIHACCSITNS